MTIDILALARECGFSNFGGAFTALDTELIAFGNAIIERCAAKCDERAEQYDAREQWQRGAGSLMCASDIRALKVQP